MRLPLAIVLAVAFAIGCSTPKHTGSGRAGVQYGQASWYHEPQMTASGERFNKRAMTAAHKTLPMHTRVRVTNRRNGRSVIVRINDRGPYAGGRIIDLSQAAAEQLGMIEAGVAPVTVEIVR